MLNRFSLGLRHKKNNVPILSQQDIECLAKMLIKEYNSDLLTTPNALDVDDFTEFFLELEMEYYYLSHNGCYFGMYVFNDSDKIPVYYPSDNTVRTLSNKEGTILLDSYLDGINNEPLRRFTLLHECSHALLHRQYYEKSEDQLSLFDFDELEDGSNIQMHAAFVSRPVQFSSGRRRLETDHDWIEWQANTLASCLLMNEDAVLNFINQYDFDVKNKFHKILLEEQISDYFIVSKEAAKIRLNVLFNNQSNTGSLL